MADRSPSSTANQDREQYHRQLGSEVDDLRRRLDRFRQEQDVLFQSQIAGSFPVGQTRNANSYQYAPASANNLPFNIPSVPTLNYGLPDRGGNGVAAGIQQTQYFDRILQERRIHQAHLDMLERQRSYLLNMSSTPYLNQAQNQYNSAYYSLPQNSAMNFPTDTVDSSDHVALSTTVPVPGNGVTARGTLPNKSSLIARLPPGKQVPPILDIETPKEQHPNYKETTRGMVEDDGEHATDDFSENRQLEGFRSPSLGDKPDPAFASDNNTKEMYFHLPSFGGLPSSNPGTMRPIAIGDHRPRQMHQPQQDLTTNKKVLLPPPFIPSTDTVVLGKGNGPKVNAGNKRLKEYVMEHLNEYANGERKEKIAIISRIIRYVRKRNIHSAAFVKFEHNQWWTATDRDARIKVTALFRDALHDQYKSSSANKVRRRQQKRKAGLEKAGQRKSTGEGE